ncbi:MAG: hypothetical protein AAGA30_12675 [Planctomycetota bacterium]
MNILIVDSQENFDTSQLQYATDRLHYSLVHFGRRIKGATMHCFVADSEKPFRCTLHVNVQELGVISIKRDGDTWDEAMSQAVNSVKPRIAHRLDWHFRYKAKINSDATSPEPATVARVSREFPTPTTYKFDRSGVHRARNRFASRFDLEI